MGGLRKYMPITHWTSLIGSLALIGFPFFSGFFSKDSIIEAVHQSQLGAAGVAYSALLIGVFITALYTFRLYFLVFWTEERMDEHTRSNLRETPWVITGPLILLAFFSVVSGFIFEPVVFGDFFSRSISVAGSHDVLAQVGKTFDGIMGFAGHAFGGAAVYLALFGVFVAWFIYIKKPHLANELQQRFAVIHRILDNKYYMDHLYMNVFTSIGKATGKVLWQRGDVMLIDGMMVNGSARIVGWFSSVVRLLQTGYLYHYAFAMIGGLAFLITFFVIQEVF